MLNIILCTNDKKVAELYRTSNDLRFRKNKVALQKALMELAAEVGLRNVTIKALTERAQVNRMTFYSHYDKIEDVISEYADDNTEFVLKELSHTDIFDIDTAIDKAQEIFDKDSEFIKVIYADDSNAFCHQMFLDRLDDVLACELAKIPHMSEHDRDVLSSMLSYGIMFTFIDWARGAFGDVPLTEVTSPIREFVKKAVRPGYLSEIG